MKVVQTTLTEVEHKLLEEYAKRNSMSIEDVLREAVNKLFLEKPTFDAVAVFEKIAKKGPSITKIDPHAYEEELEERNP
jgi:hypothetical protein